MPNGDGVCKFCGNRGTPEGIKHDADCPYSTGVFEAERGVLTSEPRVCILCKHWFLDYDEGYSEFTPGEGFVTECDKGHWSLVGPDINQREFRDNILAAETCLDYEEA